MRRAVCLWVCMHTLFWCLGACGGESAEVLFVRANELFRRGLDSSGQEREESIRKAAVLYEVITKEKGIRNGYLYYNLGNCYFHLGEIGKAILNYRRAEKLIPNYSDLKANLKSARSQRKVNIERSQMQSIARTLFFWHYIIGLKTKIVVASILFSIIWIFLLTRLFVDRSALKWGAMLCALFALMLGGSAGVYRYVERSMPIGVVLAHNTIPRKGPGESYQESFKEPLQEGTEFRVRDRQGGWLQVELDNGARCWVNSRDAELI
jgi:hypothetical protein